MGYYLLDYPPKSRQFYPTRANPATGGVGVHTTESVLDRIAPDTGAENVAAFIARRTDPGSYSEIVDTDSVVQMVPDSYTTFSVAVAGYNSRTWNIALACRSDELDPDDTATQVLIATAGARIGAYWMRNGWNPADCARWVGTGALTGPGLFNHGDVQPVDRTDAWAKHPRRADLDRMLVDAIVPPLPPSPTPTPLEDSMVFITAPGTTVWFLYDGWRKRPVGPGENQLLVDLGIVKPNAAGAPFVKVLSDAQLNAIPNV